MAKQYKANIKKMNGFPMKAGEWLGNMGPIQTNKWLFNEGWGMAKQYGANLSNKKFSNEGWRMAKQYGPNIEK